MINVENPPLPTTVAVQHIRMEMYLIDKVDCLLYTHPIRKVPPMIGVQHCWGQQCRTPTYMRNYQHQVGCESVLSIDMCHPL